jgi:hypothetical protein
MWGAQPPTFLRVFPGPRGRQDPKNAPPKNPARLSSGTQLFVRARYFGQAGAIDVPTQKKVWDVGRWPRLTSLTPPSLTISCCTVMGPPQVGAGSLGLCRFSRVWVVFLGSRPAFLPFRHYSKVCVLVAVPPTAVAERPAIALAVAGRLRPWAGSEAAPSSTSRGPAGRPRTGLVGRYSGSSAFIERRHVYTNAVLGQTGPQDVLGRLGALVYSCFGRFPDARDRARPSFFFSPVLSGAPVVVCLGVVSEMNPRCHLGSSDAPGKHDSHIVAEPGSPGSVNCVRVVPHPTGLRHQPTRSCSSTHAAE